jgi:hypothetical protein
LVKAVCWRVEVGPALGWEAGPASALAANAVVGVLVRSAQPREQRAEFSMLVAKTLQILDILTSPPLTLSYMSINEVKSDWPCGSKTAQCTAHPPKRMDRIEGT